jgi:hypothetical protein
VPDSGDHTIYQIAHESRHDARNDEPRVWRAEVCRDKKGSITAKQRSLSMNHNDSMIALLKQSMLGEQIYSRRGPISGKKQFTTRIMSQHE